MKHQAKRLALGGLAIAVIFLCTALIKIPGPLGYVHLGDAAIVAFSLALGMDAVLPALLGSALADVVGGYLVYAPVTALVKAVMAALIAKLGRRPWRARLAAVIGAEALMVAAYFVFESVLYGLPAAAGALAFNIVQGLGGAGVGLLVAPVCRRAVRLAEKQN